MVAKSTFHVKVHFTVPVKHIRTPVIAHVWRCMSNEREDKLMARTASYCPVNPNLLTPQWAVLGGGWPPLVTTTQIYFKPARVDFSRAVRTRLSF